MAILSPSRASRRRAPHTIGSLRTFVLRDLNVSRRNGLRIQQEKALRASCWQHYLGDWVYGNWFNNERGTNIWVVLSNDVPNYKAFIHAAVADRTSVVTTLRTHWKCGILFFQKSGLGEAQQRNRRIRSELIACFPAIARCTTDD